PRRMNTACGRGAILRAAAPGGDRRMKRREFMAMIGGAAVVWPWKAQALQGEGMRRLGVLMGITASDADGKAYAAALTQGLGALNWREGGNLSTEWRWAGSDPALYDRYAAELVALGPEVLLAMGSLPLDAMRRRTRTI